MYYFYQNPYIPVYHPLMPRNLPMDAYYPPMGQPAYPIQQQGHCISQAEVDYRNEMRSLWEEHVAWTRMAIISLVFDLPDIEFVLKRLLRNATEAAIAGDQQAVAEADKKWHENADEIAVFLNSVNRFLPEEVVRDMFYEHLALTKQEAVAMINKDFQKDIDVYDAIDKQARQMADAISDAMVQAYPSVF